MNFISKILVSALAILIVANISPGVKIDHILTALLVAVVLAFLNSVVKPVLTLLTIPVTIFTLGFFLLIINAIIIIFAGKLVKDFHVAGFWSAFFFSLFLSLITGILNMMFGVNREEQE
jgi:putative membrane protein